MPLATERLILRPPTPEDLDAFAAIFADPEVMRFIGDGTPRPRDDVAARLHRAAELYRQTGFCFFAVELRETGEVIGDCGIIPIARSGTDWNDYSQRGPEIELGYRLARAHWGRGYATEAAREAVRYAFQDLRLDHLIGVTDPGNVASQRVLQKCGMTHSGRTDRFYDTTVELYELPRADWVKNTD